MKTIVVISDSHGNLNAVEELLHLIVENDYCVHLGDGAGDMKGVFYQYPDKTYLCAGNCDFFAPYPSEGVLEVEDARIFYCHGHTYGVKTGLERLAARAKSLGCDVVLYGHTHEVGITELDGVTLVNPGTMKYPLGKGGTYAYLVINGKKVTAVTVGDGLRSGNK